MLLTCQHDFFSPCMFPPLPSSKSEIVKRSQNRADASACYLRAKQTFLCNLSCLGCFIIAMNNRWITFCLMALLLLLLLFRDRVSFCRSDWPEIYQLSLRASAPVCLWDYRLEPLCLTIGFPYCWHWRTLRMFWVVVHFFFFWFCKAIFILLLWMAYRVLYADQAEFALTLLPLHAAYYDYRHISSMPG